MKLESLALFVPDVDILLPRIAIRPCLRVPRVPEDRDRCTAGVKPTNARTYCRSLVCTPHTVLAFFFLYRLRVRSRLSTSTYNASVISLGLSASRRDEVLLRAIRKWRANEARKKGKERRKKTVYHDSWRLAGVGVSKLYWYVGYYWSGTLSNSKGTRFISGFFGGFSGGALLPSQTRSSLFLSRIYGSARS